MELPKSSRGLIGTHPAPSKPLSCSRAQEGTHQLLQLGQVLLCDDLLAVAVLLRLMDAADEEEEEGRQQGAAEQAHLSTAEQRLRAVLDQ